MKQMKPKARLFWCAVMIVGSVLYAILVSVNPRVASAIMLGYIAFLLTIFVLIEVWRKPHG